MVTEPSETNTFFDERCFSCCDLLEQLQYMKTHVYYKLVRNIHTIHNYPFTVCSEIIPSLVSPLQRFKEQDV